MMMMMMFILLRRMLFVSCCGIRTDESRRIDNGRLYADTNTQIHPHSEFSFRTAFGQFIIQIQQSCCGYRITDKCAVKVIVFDHNSDML